MRYLLTTIITLLLSLTVTNSEAQVLDKLKEKSKQLKEKVSSKSNTKTKAKGEFSMNHGGHKTPSLLLRRMQSFTLTYHTDGYRLQGEWTTHNGDKADGFDFIVFDEDTNIENQFPVDTKNYKSINSDAIDTVETVEQHALINLHYDALNTPKQSPSQYYQSFELTRGNFLVQVLDDQSFRISFGGFTAVGKKQQKIRGFFTGSGFTTTEEKTSLKSIIE